MSEELEIYLKKYMEYPQEIGFFIEFDFFSLN